MDTKKLIQTICLSVVISVCLGVIFSVVVVATYEEIVDSKIVRLQEERAALKEAREEFETERWKLMQMQADFWKDVWERPAIKEIIQELDKRDEERAKEEEKAARQKEAADESKVSEEVRPAGGKDVLVPAIYVRPRWNVVTDALKEDGAVY